jgi:adenylate cyclase
MSQTRRLAAILAADVAGYSRLMGADEEGTLERLKALRRELFDPKIAEHHGRIVKTTGDGSWSSSPASSMRCAAPSRCSRRCPSGTRVSRWRAASSCASASISAT